MTLAAAIAHSNLRPERYSKISVARATLSSAKVAVLTISESVRLTSFMLEPERIKLSSGRNYSFTAVCCSSLFD